MDEKNYQGCLYNLPMLNQLVMAVYMIKEKNGFMITK